VTVNNLISSSFSFPSCIIIVAGNKEMTNSMHQQQQQQQQQNQLHRPGSSNKGIMSFLFLAIPLIIFLANRDWRNTISLVDSIKLIHNSYSTIPLLELILPYQQQNTMHWFAMIGESIDDFKPSPDSLSVDLLEDGRVLTAKL